MASEIKYYCLLDPALSPDINLVWHDYHETPRYLVSERGMDIFFYKTSMLMQRDDGELAYVYMTESTIKLLKIPFKKDVYDYYFGPERTKRPR